MDKDDEIIDSPKDDDNQDVDKDLENTEDIDNDDNVEDETDVTALKEKNKQLFARAKKAEGFVLKNGKWVKKLEKSDTTKKLEAKDTSSEDVLTRDEAMLIAGGVDAEDLEQLKAIQKGTGVSLSEAVKNPMYEAYKEKKVKEAKRKKAQLGAGSGSGGGESDDINKPGLTEEEHRKLWSK